MYNPVTKKFDLEERTLIFASQTRDFLSQLPYSLISQEYIKQLTRSSASIGANYIEASEALGKKDFLMRMRISRKEAKESIYWLKLIKTSAPELNQTRSNLINEGTQLMKIFGSIVIKLQNKP